MPCTMLYDGTCLKQAIGTVSTGFFVRRSKTLFRECQFYTQPRNDDRDQAWPHPQSIGRQENCSMYEDCVLQTPN